jgi:hypothetical protein
MPAGGRSFSIPEEFGNVQNIAAGGHRASIAVRRGN